jgi:truncated hemoglobin YjbI
LQACFPQPFLQLPLGQSNAVNKKLTKMTLEQALNSLYNAARHAPLTAEQHEIVKKCAEQIAEALKSVSETKKE